MQLEDLESIVYKMYTINLKKLMHLGKLRKEDGLDVGDSAEYHNRIKEDDRYCQISAEIDRIRSTGDIKAKIRLYELLSDFKDEISDSQLEEVRKSGKPGIENKRHVFARAKRRFYGRAYEKEDKDFLESCGIKGETSWIEN